MKRPGSAGTQRWAALAVAIGAALAAAACDRNIEPFDPAERPSRPDLSRIFPERPEAATGAQAEPARVAEVPAPAGAQRGNVASGAAIRGRIELLGAGAPPGGSTLFVIARRAGAAGGPPLAVQRIPSPRFPVDFEIGQAQVMIPGLRFEGSIDLSARLDADGNPLTRAPGDLEGRTASPVSPGASDVVISLGG